MKQKSPAPGATAPQTHAVPFLTCTDTGQNLFAVQPGIPYEDACKKLSLFMTIAHELLEDANGSLNVEAGHIAAYYILGTAKAIVESLPEDFGVYQEGGAA
ncbi:hypothetical protein AGMMS50256_29000 [Betaproteobacteria bacterium]|nr:hypothetical protein AGMMS50256_29000 [Betaproteobacteria bacterium]